MNIKNGLVTILKLQKGKILIVQRSATVTWQQLDIKIWMAK